MRPNPSIKMDAPLDLNTAYTEAIKSHPRWHNLGLALGVDNNYLDSLQHNNGTDEDRLRDMLTRYFNTNSGFLSRKQLCTALRSPTVCRIDVAEEIERKSQQLPVQNTTITSSHQIGQKRPCSEHAGGSEPPTKRPATAQVPSTTGSFQTLPPTGPTVMNFNAPVLITYGTAPTTAPTMNQPEGLNSSPSSSSSDASDPNSSRFTLRDGVTAICNAVAATYTFEQIVAMIEKLGWDATKDSFSDTLFGARGVGLAGYLLELILKDRGYTGPEYWYADKAASAGCAAVQGAMAAWPLGLWGMIMGALAGLGFWLAARIAGYIITWLIEKSKQWFSGR